jgi:hypothetical protein
MVFSSSNGSWHFHRHNDWHGQHDHYVDQGDGLVWVLDRMKTYIRGYRRCLSPDLTPYSLLQGIRLKMDEDLEKCVIETVSVVMSH